MRAKMEELLVTCKGPGKLHPLHVRCFDVLMPLVNACRATGDVVDAIKYLTALVQAHAVLHPSATVELGALYALLGECHRARARNINDKLASRPKKQAKEALQKAIDIRRICQGSDRADVDELVTLLEHL